MTDEMTFLSALGAPNLLAPNDFQTDPIPNLFVDHAALEGLLDHATFQADQIQRDPAPVEADSRSEDDSDSSSRSSSRSPSPKRHGHPHASKDLQRVAAYFGRTDNPQRPQCGKSIVAVKSTNWQAKHAEFAAKQAAKQPKPAIRSLDPPKAKASKRKSKAKPKAKPKDKADKPKRTVDGSRKGETYFPWGMCPKCHDEGFILLQQCEDCLYKQGCALAYDDKCRLQTVAVSFWRYLDGTDKLSCNRF
jgi:hypothetical protein